MMDAYVGAETGALKGIDFSKNSFQNFNSVASLDRSQEISRMCRIPTRLFPRIQEVHAAEQAEESVLCALVNRQLKLFDPSTNSFTTLFSCDGDQGAIKGLESLESGKIVTCVDSGEVSIWNTDGYSKEASLNAGDNICRMRRNPAKPNILATGGRENPLKLWDLENPKQPVFVAKNVKHDWLDLRVPIWETDFRFSFNNECIITCTGNHHIRLYDPRTTQRRPVIQVEWGECPFTSISLTPKENEVVAGNSQGYMGLFDLRGKGTSKLVHCYKGFAGSVSSIECHPTEPYVASCGIDRFARLYHLYTRQQLNKIYCKARLNCLLLSDDLTITRYQQADDGADDSAKAYQSDKEALSDDDTMWNDMRKVDDRRKRRYSASSASTSESGVSIGSDSDKRTKPRKKKQRNSVSITTPMKRAASPTVSRKLQKRKKTVGEDKKQRLKRKRKACSDSPSVNRKWKVQEDAT